MSASDRRRRILLVDPSSAAVKHARVALEFEGFVVSEAGDAASGLAAALAYQTDVEHPPC